MRNCWKVLLPLVLVTSCQEEGIPGPDDRRVDVSALSHGMIELGESDRRPDGPVRLYCGGVFLGVGRVEKNKARLAVHLYA